MEKAQNPISKKLTLRFSTNDGKVFDIDTKVARGSELFNKILAEFEEDEDYDTVSLDYVDGNTLTKVIEWMVHHKDDDDPAQTDIGVEEQKTLRDVSEWEHEFFKIDQDVLINLILAANYLDIKNLLDLGCLFLANKIKGKSVEEIRKMMYIQKDFTPEEEEQICKENEWLEEM